MATESKNVGTAVNDSSGGTNAWTNPTNFEGNTSLSYANGNCGSAGPIDKLYCKLVKGGSMAGNTKTAYPVSKASYSLGGASDLWGVSLSASDVNASNFGFAVQGESAQTTQYLKATGMGFDIPTGATIDGVKIDVTAEAVRALGVVSIRCYLALVTVYYTDSPGGSGKAMRSFARII